MTCGRDRMPFRQPDEPVEASQEGGAIGWVAVSLGIALLMALAAFAPGRLG